MLQNQRMVRPGAASGGGGGHQMMTPLQQQQQAHSMSGNIPGMTLQQMQNFQQMGHISKKQNSVVYINYIYYIYNIILRLQTILLTKTTAAKNEVALSYHRVRGLYFLADKVYMYYTPVMDPDPLQVAHPKRSYRSTMRHMPGHGSGSTADCAP